MTWQVIWTEILTHEVWKEHRAPVFAEVVIIDGNGVWLSPGQAQLEFFLFLDVSEQVQVHASPCSIPDQPSLVAGGIWVNIQPGEGRRTVRVFTQAHQRGIWAGKTGERNNLKHPKVKKLTPRKWSFVGFRKCIWTVTAVFLSSVTEVDLSLFRRTDFASLQRYTNTTK